MAPRRRGAAWWLLPVVDFASAALSLTIVSLMVGASPFPAVPLAALLPVAIYALLHGYVSGPPSVRADGKGAAWPVVQLVAATPFVWVASEMMGLGLGLGLALLILFALLAKGARHHARQLVWRLYSPERWLLIGAEPTAELLRRAPGLREHAVVVATLSSPEVPGAAHRLEALEAVDRYGADRVVIADRDAGDADLLELLRAFKSTGVPVSLLPRPLDLLEAPGALPSETGGVAMIEVEALASRAALAYKGPDRRRDRRTHVTVVVPALNEGRNIGEVLARLPEGLHEVILVDGRSRDDTVAAARRACPEIRVLTQAGRGKGDALRLGFAATTGNLIVTLDADGSADPAEIPRFVTALEAGADFAKGSRFLPGGGSADITRTRRLGNRFLSGAANLLHDAQFTDLCYGYNAFWARCLPLISLDVPGFEVETLINLRVADAGMRIVEVPSYEANRISGQSNLKTFRDGLRVLRTIVGEAQRRRTIHPDRNPMAEMSSGNAGATAI